MLTPDNSTDRFLYKVKKWGEVNQDICLLLYTDHTKEEAHICSYCFSIFVVVQEYLDFTKKLYWLEFFGETQVYKVTLTDEGTIIEVDYENKLKVKFVIVASGGKQSSDTCEGLGVLMNKRHNRKNCD